MALMLLPFLAGTVQGQVSLNGSLDLVAGGGGRDARFVTTEMPNSFYHGHLVLQEFHLVTFAPVGEFFSIEAELRADSWGDGRLHTPQLGFASFNYTPDPNLFHLSLGRIITPFGYEHQKIYPFQRTFITRPLAYSWFLNLSETKGYWPSAGDNGSYPTDDVGVTTLGYRGLTTGLRADWILAPGAWDFTLALTDATPSAEREWMTQFSYAATAILAWHASDRVTHRLSAAWGSWMSQDPALEPLLGNPAKYRQTLIGLDARYNLKPIEIVWEAIGSKWSAPRYADAAFVPVESGGTTPAGTVPALITGWLDVKWTVSEKHQGYVAGRWDMLRPMKMNDPGDGSSTTWDTGVNRWSFVFGWSLADQVHTKLSYSNQTRDDEIG
ncbi:MAG: hypothetical protein V2A56_05220, partial [bacterium]